MIKIRDAMSWQVVNDASRRIRRAIKAWISQHTISHIMGYYPTRNEPNVMPLLRWGLQQGHAVYLPAWDGQAYVMSPWHPHHAMDQDPYGIPTPMVLSPPPLTHQPCLWLVPGLLFSSLGHRWGYGKGHYDRLLSQENGPKMGVAYHWQVYPNLPQHSHDIPMTHLATETGIITV